MQQVPRLMGILYALLVQFYGWAVSSLQYLTSQSAARLVKMQEMAEFYVVNVPNISYHLKRMFSSGAQSGVRGFLRKKSS